MRPPAILDTLGGRRFDAVIVVPPFCELHYPALGAHTVQACARKAGFQVGIFYANLHFAALIGVDRYAQVSRVSRGTFAGERLFARTAYGVPALGEHADDICGPARAIGGAIGSRVYGDFTPGTGEFLEALPGLERAVPSWVDAVGDYLAELDAAVIGATSTFEQTAAAVALLKAVKRRRPDVVAIMGGANCEGEMAEGVLTLAPFLDYVFSGESETTFPAFLAEIAAARRPSARIVTGSPCRDLDAIPPLDYDDYFAQRAAALTAPDAARIEAVSLPYETSRGCWWGEKHHCTFCGLNGEGMVFRVRSVSRTVADLRALTGRYGVTKILMADNIMPYRFFGTLLPRLAADLPDLSIFYEQKANLGRDRLLALKQAGINTIQPGIEALSSDLLRLMKKGVSAAQNIGLLRDARGLGISLIWNLLWGFPQDSPEHYEQTLRLLPSLIHLQPPGGFWPVMIDRFSPYFERPQEYGVSALRPLAGYFDILPPDASAAKIAYHFEGDFVSGSYRAPGLLSQIQQEVAGWRAAWMADRVPELRLGDYKGTFVIVDTRGLPGTEPFDVLDPEEAARLTIASPYEDDAVQRALIARRLALRIDERFVPLPVIDEDTLRLVRARSANAAAPAELATDAAVT